MLFDVLLITPKFGDNIEKKNSGVTYDKRECLVAATK